MNGDYISFDEVLQILSIREDELQQLVSMGELRGILMDGTLQFPRDEVVKFVDELKADPSHVLTETNIQIDLSLLNESLLLQNTSPPEDSQAAPAANLPDFFTNVPQDQNYEKSDDDLTAVLPDDSQFIEVDETSSPSSGDETHPHMVADTPSPDMDKTTAMSSPTSTPTPIPQGETPPPEDSPTSPPQEKASQTQDTAPQTRETSQVNQEGHHHDDSRLDGSTLPQKDDETWRSTGPVHVRKYRIKPGDPIIEFRSVTKVLSNRTILNDLSFKICRGETMVIIGRSGTGKSVTLKHMLGFMTPDKGDVFVYGRNLKTMDRKELAEMRKKFGVLFQSGALLNSLTIAENVELPLAEHRRDLSWKKRQEIVDQKLEMVEMIHARDNYPSEISGGMKKRAGMARAIVLEPDIVMYDEPTSGLDPIMSNSINEMVISMQNQLNITSIVVTHDMSSAYSIADRIAMLYDGKVAQLGTPEDIKNTDSDIVRQFIDGDTRGPITA